jgi:Glycosyl transferase family 2
VRVEVITAWHNQAFLAPFFLDHYRYADRINIGVDARTDDDTLAICARYPNVAVDSIRSSGPLDDEQRLARINTVYRALRCDWVFAVDADEFLFPLPWGTNPRPALNREHDFDVVLARTLRVHRHRSEADLDPRRPAVPQRRHGVADADQAIEGPGTRPLIVRGGLNAEWTAGRCAFGRPGLRISPHSYGCAHWARADLAPGAEREQHLDDPRLF